MSSLKSHLIAILVLVSACGRQVVEFRLGDAPGGSIDSRFDAGLDGRGDARLDGPHAIDAGLDAPLPTAPTIVSTIPASGAIGVALNTAITATFDRPMDPATLTMSTFTVRHGATPVNGTVALDVAGTTARFTPTVALLNGLGYTATITTGAHDTAGTALAANYPWSWKTADNALPPTVISTTPLANAMNVSVNKKPTATFSKSMDPATITGATFTLQQGINMIAGTVALDSATNTATFAPTMPLMIGLTYTATITTGAKDTGGTPLAMNYTWSFMTDACGQGPITLGVAGNFAVLAGSTVTNTGLTTVTGDLGVSPGTAVTGFPPGILVGTQHTDPTSATAIANLTTAFDEAAGRTLCAVTVAGNLGGQTLPPGLYKSTSFLEISSGDLTLDAQGDVDAVWVFQMATTLTTTINRQVILVNGAKPGNVYWQVGSSATIGIASMFQGTIMADQAITLSTGATLKGRALARIAAVTLDTNAVVIP